MFSIGILMPHPIELTGTIKTFKNKEQIKSTDGFLKLENLIDFLQSQQLDCILIDLFGVEKTAEEILPQLHSLNQHLKIVILGDDKPTSFILSLIDKGADAYLIKGSSSGTKLYDTALQTLNGNVVLDEKIEEKILNNISDKKKKVSLNPVVTKREKEILTLIAQGLTNKEIAQQLFISINTVTTHRKNLMAKLDVKNTIGLCKKAQELGLSDK